MHNYHQPSSHTPSYELVVRCKIFRFYTFEPKMENVSAIPPPTLPNWLQRAG